MTREQRKRLAAIRAIAPLAVPPGSPDQPAGKTEKAGDERPPENLPQTSRASHYS
jgi:hypothetical protein